MHQTTDADSSVTPFVEPVTPVKRHLYRPDAPIETDEQDELDRGPFVDELKSFVTGWTRTGARTSSYVIALCGPWGASKTSILRLLVERFSRAFMPPTVLVFSPWQFTSADVVAAAFFRDVSNAIGGRDEEVRHRKAAASFRAYAARVGMVSETVPFFGRARALAGALAAAVLTLGADAALDLSVIPPAVRQIGIPVAGGALVVLALVEGTLGRMATLRSAQADRAKMTLDELRRQIRDQMRALDRPLFIAIDDLDRLEPDELRLVMQLVRSNADVPNLVFLLLMDIDRSRQILGRDGHTSATGLIDKVVQTELHIPSVPQQTINDYLQRALLDPAALGGDRPLLAVEPDEALDHAIRRVVSTYVVDLRAVNRLLNGVSFQSARLRSGGRLTVFPADLLLVETLRLFDPAVYARLVDAADFLLEEPYFTSTGKDKRSARVEALVEGARHPDVARAALSLLFEQVATTTQSVYRFGPDRADWQSAGRLQYPGHFWRYFTTHESENALSTTDADALSGAIQAGLPIEDILEAHATAFKLGSALEIVSGSAADAPPDSVPDLLIAVLPYIERVTEVEGGGGYMRDRGRMRSSIHIVERAINRLPDSPKRLAVLVALASEYPHATGYLSSLSPELGVATAKGEDQPPRLLSPPDAKAFRAVVGESSQRRLRSLSNETLLAYARPLELYIRWMNWSDVEQARSWLLGRFEDESGETSAATLSMFKSDIRTPDGKRSPFALDQESLFGATVGSGGFDTHAKARSALYTTSKKALSNPDLPLWAAEIHYAAAEAFPPLPEESTPDDITPSTGGASPASD